MNQTGQPLTIEYRDPGSLVAYERNARTHSAEQVEQIARSIEQFGFCNPILVDSGGVVVAGHGRLLAATRLKLEQVPVVQLDHVTPQQARALRIADNQIALTSGWNLEMLAEELGDLDDLGVDLDVLGFGDEELSALLGIGSGPVSIDLESGPHLAHKGQARTTKCPRCGHEF